MLLQILQNYRSKHATKRFIFKAVIRLKTYRLNSIR